MQWTVLIPAKALPAAKSRLAPRSADADAHRRLVEAIRTDTVDAALAAAGVARVVLVVDRPGPGLPAGAEILVQRRPGLNAALVEGAGHARSSWPGDGVAALLGDLPALRPDELGAALRAAGDVPRGYVADADGTGTTLLTARAGESLTPQFGAGSAARHAESATVLVAGDGLRRDVDTDADLLAALALGLGPATRAALIASGDPAASVCVGPRSPGTGIVGA